MLNYTETARIGTNLPTSPVTCCQPQYSISFSSASSYTVGPIDQAQITTHQVQLSTGDTCTLLVPVTIPCALFHHPDFQQGYECGYLNSYTEEDGLTVPKLLNDLYQSLEGTYNRRGEDPDMSFWTPGHTLGDMAGVAEWDKPLALTGLAHLCFLLPFFTQPRLLDWPSGEAYYPLYPHSHAIKAYRRQVRSFRGQGKSFVDAQRLALC
ncbi:MAG TPA: hypothetical protein VH593_12370 [Ktedonobacteraceae bacterium]